MGSIYTHQPIIRMIVILFYRHNKINDSLQQQPYHFQNKKLSDRLYKFYTMNGID